MAAPNSPPSSSVTRPDGSLDWSMGVDSLRAPTAQSANNPNGLPKNALAWASNATMRGSGITQRYGWQSVITIGPGSLGLFQGEFMYQPDSGNPYKVVSIGGHLYKVPLDGSGPVVDLTATAFTSNPFTSPVGPYLVLQNLNAPQVTNYWNGTSIVIIPTAFVLTINLPAIAPVAPAGINGWINVSTNAFTPGALQLPSIGQNFRASVAGYYGGNVGDQLAVTYDFQVVSRISTPYAGYILKNLNCPLGTIVTVYAREFPNSPTSGMTAPAIGANVDWFTSLDVYNAQLHVGSTIHFDHNFTVVAFNTDPTLNQQPSTPFNNATSPTAYFEQAEEFLVIQSGDGITLPLIWDGNRLFRSLGIQTSTPPSPPTPGINQIPAATCMRYYNGYLWYAQGNRISAGDGLGDANSGTLAYGFRDSVINVTENPLALGGDGITLAANSGDVTAINYSANINATFGQGQLYIFTRDTVYGVTVPTNRAAWIGSGNTGGSTSTQITVTVVQINYGTTGDRSIVAVNGDLFYQSMEPAIRSLVTAVRFFGQWGNLQISSNEFRILNQVNVGLLYAASGIEFDNRLLQTTLPVQTPNGIVHQGIIPLDYLPIGTLQEQLPPVWEGVWEGLNILQLATGDFGGNKQAYATVVSEVDGSFQVWQLTDSNKFQNGTGRVTWTVETPAFTWGDEFELKKLVSAELWMDLITGFVDFTVEYRPDGETCWTFWYQWGVCNKQNLPTTPQGYPIVPCGTSYCATVTLPVPPVNCDMANLSPGNRPSNVGYQFQLRLTVKGYCRIRGLLVHAVPVERKLYGGKVC